MQTLDIQLFGSFQLGYVQQPITTINKRGQSLLAYLLLYRHQAHTREALAPLLWPETNDAQARTNLRKDLMRLRRAFAEFGEFGEFDHYVRDDHGTLQWRQDAPFTLDVMAFEQAIAHAEAAEDNRDEAGALAAFQNAIHLYSGDLLTKIYEDWVLYARQRLADQFVYALERTSTLLKKRGDYPQAIRYAQRLLQYDPLHEVPYRQLMEIHARNGDHANVKRVYQTCATLLQRELDVAPSPLTQRLYQAIIQPG